MSLEEISEIEELKNEEIEKGKELLATKVTELVHGKNADWTSKKSISFKKREFEKGYGLLNLLSNKKVNLAKSNSEARRFVKSKAIKLNNNLITDEKYLVEIDNFTNDDELQISLGKKITIIIKLD